MTPVHEPAGRGTQPDETQIHLLGARALRKKPELSYTLINQGDRGYEN